MAGHRRHPVHHPARAACPDDRWPARRPGDRARRPGPPGRQRGRRRHGPRDDPIVAHRHGPERLCRHGRWPRRRPRRGAGRAHRDVRRSIRAGAPPPTTGPRRCPMGGWSRTAPSSSARTPPRACDPSSSPRRTGPPAMRWPTSSPRCPRSSSSPSWSADRSPGSWPARWVRRSAASRPRPRTSPRRRSIRSPSRVRPRSATSRTGSTR